MASSITENSIPCNQHPRDFEKILYLFLVLGHFPNRADHAPQEHFLYFFELIINVFIKIYRNSHCFCFAEEINVLFRLKDQHLDINAAIILFFLLFS